MRQICARVEQRGWRGRVIRSQVRPVRSLRVRSLRPIRVLFPVEVDTLHGGRLLTFLARSGEVGADAADTAFRYRGGRNVMRTAASKLLRALVLLGAISLIGSIQTAAGTTPSPLGRPGCSPPSSWGPRAGEIQATTLRGSVWALFGRPNGTRLLDQHRVIMKFTGRSDAKIIIRATGPGIPRFVLETPTAGRQTPTWGPEAHAGSTFDHPGSEWGMGFDFPTAGCYELRVQRGHTIGRIWLQVR